MPAPSSLVCEYCSNVYKDPRILSCLHSFCLQCISQQQIHEEGTTVISCSSCNHSTSLPPEGGVASLPVNIRLLEEVKEDEVIKKLSSSPPPQCESCEKKNSSSVAYCRDCNDMLCAECWNMHKKMKISRSHSTIGLNKRGNTKTVAPSSSSSVPICPAHDDQKLCFYCTKCHVLVCARCTMDRHTKDNGHLVEGLEEQASRSKTEILLSTERLPAKMNELEQLMKDIEEMNSKIDKRKQEVDNGIHEAFAKLHQLIDKREKALLNENWQIAMAKQTRLTMQSESTQHVIKSIIQCHSLASVAAKEYSDVQLLSIAHSLHTRATDLQQQFTKTFLDVCDALAVELDTDDLAYRIEQFGNVVDTSPKGSNTTASIPCRRLGIGAETKVLVTARNGSGNEIRQGGANLQAKLHNFEIEDIQSLAATDCLDGTYLISIVPEQLGRQQLSVTINNQHIQNSPFTLNVLPHHDYAELENPVITITGINRPRYIAFADNGDMFVTSDDHCIYVYDSSGNKKNTIGSKGSGVLQFNCPHGIDIDGETVYVVDRLNARIHMLTTGGEFIGTFNNNTRPYGEHFTPYAVKISPNGKVFVVDRSNDRIQVFNSDLTFYQTIHGKFTGDFRFSSPGDIAFDPSCNAYVTGNLSNTVKILGNVSPSYLGIRIDSPEGIAIDSFGYILITSYDNGTLSVFNPCRRLIYSVGGLRHPYGVSISPLDGSVWVADTGNNRLVKY